MRTWTVTIQITLRSRIIAPQLKEQLKALKDNEFINDKLYYYMKPSDSPAPRFYGQPKIFMPGVPICPIVSYSGYFGESKRSLNSRSDNTKDLSGIAIVKIMKL